MKVAWRRAPEHYKVEVDADDPWREISTYIYTLRAAPKRSIVLYVHVEDIHAAHVETIYSRGSHPPKQSTEGALTSHYYLLEQACSCGYELIKRRAICRKGDQDSSMSWLVLLLAWITTQLEIYITYPGSSPHLTDNICVQSYNHVNNVNNA